MKKILFVPLTLLALFAFVVVSCEETKKDDVCQAFNAITQTYPGCEVPSVCCPVDEGNCYYVAPDGTRYTCNASQATTEDPDGCLTAQNQYIAANCETSKMDASGRERLVLELTAFTRQMMLKARNYSVCH